MNINKIKAYMNMLIKLFIAIAASICITNLTNAYTNIINTKTKFLFGFVFYCFISLGVLYLYNKYLSNYKEKRKLYMGSVLLALILAVSTIIIGKDIFININHKIQLTIQATGEKNSNSNSSEVWITNIKVNDIIVDISTIELSDGWELRDGKCIISNINQPSSLKLNFNKSDKVEVEFLCHPWSGIVNIVEGDLQEVKDLYSKENNVYKYVPEQSNLSLPINRETIFNSMIAMLFLFSIFYLFITLINKHKFLSGIYVFIVYFIEFFINNKLEYDIGFKVIMFVVTIISSVLISKMFMNNDIKKLYNKKIFFFMIILGLYSAFALIGSNVFLKIKYIDITFENIFTYIIMVIWCISIIISSFYLLYKLSYKFVKEKYIVDNKQINNLSIIVFFIILFMGIIYTVAFYPGNMTADSISQWGQAIGAYPLNDTHPAFNTLIIRLLINIYPSPIMVILVQLLFFDFVITASIIFLYKRGLKKSYCIIIALVIMLKPDNIVNICTMWKDIPYSVCILWITCIIAKLVDNEEYLSRKLNNVKFTSCLILTSLLRHNGLVVIICTFICILFLINNKNKPKSIVCYIAALVVVLLIKGPIYNSLNVTEISPGVKYAAMMNDMEGVVFSDGNLGNKTIDFFDSITVRDNIKKMYNPFSFNENMFGQGVKYNVLSKMENKTTTEFISMYLDTFFRNPLLIFQNRLNGIDIMWNIYQRTDSYDYRYSIGIDDNVFNLNSKVNSLTNILSKYLDISWKVRSLDILTWRAGICVILVLITTAFMWLTNRRRYIIITIPVYANIVSLLLSMTWQDYRYVWFIQLTVWFIIATTITGNDSDLNNCK